MNSFAEEYLESSEKIVQFPSDPIKRLFLQIKKMPELTDQARVIDQVHSLRLQELKGTASIVINQLANQQKLILQKFDHWIEPIAKEVLNGFLYDAQKLKSNLEDKLDHIEETSPEDWNDQVDHWSQLIEKWNDGKGLINKILDAVAEKTKNQIEKDIKVIHDYRSQSLAHLPKESETFRNVEERLNHAIAEPLKQLKSLQKAPQSIQQASEWVAKLQESRESYFDQLLMKIDQVTKEMAVSEDQMDPGTLLEIEGEMVFMEQELQHIKKDLVHIQQVEESERQFLAARLESLLDHM